jgi:hypothetical protein
MRGHRALRAILGAVGSEDASTPGHFGIIGVPDPDNWRQVLVALPGAGTNSVLAWLQEMDTLRQAGIAA